MAGRNRPLRRFRRLLFYAVVRGFAAGLRRIPGSGARAVFGGLGWFAWASRPGDRQTAHRQIAQAFPRMSHAQRRRFVRASFTFFGRNLVDSLRGDRDVFISSIDRRQLEGLVASGRPLLLLTAHLGPWEQLGRFLAAELGELGVVTANPHNARLDRWMRSERQRAGMRPFDRRAGALGAARWLKRGKALAVLSDLRGAVSNVYAPWFGRPAQTAVGPARLARWAGAAIVPVAIRGLPEGAELLLGSEVPWNEGDDESTVAARCNEALEKLIRRAPEQWIWFHDRYGDSVSLGGKGEGS